MVIVQVKGRRWGRVGRKAEDGNVEAGNVEAWPTMLLVENGELVTVGLLVKVLSPGIGRPLLGSPRSMVTDAFVSVTIVVELVASASILVMGTMEAGTVEA